MIFFIMAGAMAFAAIVAKFGMPRGKAPEMEILEEGDGEAPESASPKPAS